MTLGIIKIDTDERRAVKRFIDLPFRLYRDCPQWVPPLVDDVKLMLNRHKYPFYEHSNADFFLAESNGQVVGRLAILANRHYNEYWHSQTAFFYLFDAENDPEAALALFAAGEEWARGRGLNKVVGAKGFLQGDGIGILVDGFQYHPAVGIPYNYEYYGALIEAAGYTRQRDFYSAYLPGDAPLPERFAELAEKVKERRGFTIKRFKDKAELKAMVPQIVQTYNDTFTDNWEFNAVTPAEAQIIGERLLQIADPRYIKLVMKDDVIAGFMFGFQDIYRGLQRSRGRLWPFGWFWILRAFRNTEWININGAGILAPYRGLGVNVLMYHEMKETIEEGHFKHADMVQMEESVLTLKDTESAGGHIFKTHRIYEKALA
jgi:hypothetical protein